MANEAKTTIITAAAAVITADHPGGVPDEVWEQAARHYDEPALAALVVTIAAINA